MASKRAAEAYRKRQKQPLCRHTFKMRVEPQGGTSFITTIE